MKRTLAVIIFFLVSAFLPIRRAVAQPPGADVVVLALESSKQSSDLASGRLLERMLGMPTSRTLIDIQMDIVRKTLPFGPVLLVVPDDSTAAGFMADCATYDLCDALFDGRVRLSVVPHDSVWIRDYGPFIESGNNNSLRVVDTNYDDDRQDASLNHALRVAAESRLKAIEHLRDLESGDDESVRLEARLLGGAKADKQALAEILQHEANYWRDFAEVLHEMKLAPERLEDDRAPYGVATALMADRAFTFETTELVVDGGNLTKLDDTTCLTTHGLYRHNPAKQGAVRDEIGRLFHCRDIVILEPMPGKGIIDHVDMFVLPVQGRRLILPDYSLSQKYLVDAWGNLDDDIRDLMTQAAIAMKTNEQRLRRAGFDVVLVPGLPPRKRADNSVYYPTTLNALMRSNGSHRQLLVPRYADYFEEIQNQSLGVLRAEFGADTAIETIESTAAAEAQGAVHCLTITAPLAPSVFAGPYGDEVRKTLEQRAVIEIHDQLNNPSLLGTWIVKQGNRAASTSSKDGFQVVFDERRVRFQSALGGFAGNYEVKDIGKGESAKRWRLEIVFEKSQAKTHARVEWISNRQATLVLEDGDAYHLMKAFNLADLPTAERRLPVDDDVFGTLDETDERDENGARMQAWAFEAHAGDRVELTAVADKFTPLLSVVGPGFDTPETGESVAAFGTAFLTLTFPETGLYKIVVRSSSAKESGDFLLGSEREVVKSPWASPEELSFLASLSPRKPPLRLSGQIHGAIKADTPEAPDEARLEAFTLARCDGEQIQISVTSEDIDTLLIVLGSNMEAPLVNDDDERSLDGTNSRLVFECEPGSTYKVFAGSYDGAPGKYELKTEKLPGSTSSTRR